MKSIEIRRPHALSHVAAIKLVQSIAEDLAEQYEVEHEWDGDALRFKRPGIKGAIHILPSEVHLRAELGFLFMPLRSMIEGHIVKFLDEHALSSDPAATAAALRQVASANPLGGKRSTSAPPSASKPAASKSVAKKDVVVRPAAKKVAKKTTKAAKKLKE